MNAVLECDNDSKLCDADMVHLGTKLKSHDRHLPVVIPYDNLSRS